MCKGQNLPNGVVDGVGEFFGHHILVLFVEEMFFLVTI